MIVHSALDQLLAARGINPTDADGVWRLTEKRRTRRAPLHWTVFVLNARSTHPFRTETRDISRDGLYCVLAWPVAAGDRMECDIVLPTHSSMEKGEAAFLRCRAHVVRVEETNLPGYFGVGCTIEDYQLVYGSAEQTPPAIQNDPES